MSEIVEFANEVCGVYFRSVLLPFAGMSVKQHAHEHDHATYVGNGSVRLVADGVVMADYKAGEAIEVKAGVQHQFISLEPMTRLTCVHIAESAEAMKEIPLNRLPVIQET